MGTTLRSVYQSRSRAQKIIAAFCAALIAVGAVVVGSATIANAAGERGFVPNSIKVVHQDGTAPSETNPVRRYENLKITGKWNAPEGVKTGETFSLEIPTNYFKVHDGTTFDLKRTGSSVVYANCDVASQKITCTYTSEAEAQAPIDGDFFFTAQAWWAQDAEEFTFTSNGEVFVVTVPGGIKEPIDTDRPKLELRCWWDNATTASMDVRFPGGVAHSGKLTITRGEIDLSRIMLEKAPDGAYTGTNWQLVSGADRAKLTYSLSADKRTLTYNLAAIGGAGDTYRLSVASAVTRPPGVHGDKVECSLESNDGDKTNAGWYTATGGGDGSGSARPVMPAVVQAVCEGPVEKPASVTLPTTEGITYSMDPASPQAGDKVTVTAVAQPGFVLGFVQGWTFDDGQTARMAIDLATVDCTTPVTPVMPAVTQAICTDGVLVAPKVTPADTDGITYTVSGTMAPTQTVTITANPARAGVVIQPADGWTAGENGTYTTTVTFDDVDCAPVVPVAPAVTQAVCTDGQLTAPTVTPATTEGITYTVEGDVVPGAIVAVTATPAPGYAITPTAGWIPGDKGTFTTKVQLAEVECAEVMPVAPAVTQAVCTDGTVVDPKVTPATTEGITYTVTGEVAPGATVTVTATPAAGSSIAPTEGWEASDKGTYTKTIVLDNVECAPVQPVSPSVTQAVCTDGTVIEPTISLVSTAGITYTVDGTVAVGETVTVTATPAAGYAIEPTEGWEAGEKGVFTKKIVLDNVECAPVTPVAPAVTQAVCTDGVLVAPSVTPATTAGITYTVTGEVVPGATVVVTATPADGSAIEPTEGWTAGENGTFAKKVVLDNVECAQVVPVAPVVTQAVCTDGTVVAPTVTPGTTEGITYTVTGEVAVGKTVVVTATPVAGSAIVPTDGWTAGENGTFTREVVLDDVTCAPSAPVSPQVTQAVCTDGVVVDPTVTPATTENITYTTEGDIVSGGTVVVIATPAAGFALEAADGWTPGENGTATYTVTLDKVECIAVTPVKPSVKASVCVGGNPTEPSVVLPTTQGITYRVLDGFTAATANVFAGPQPGYSIAPTAGWTLVEDGYYFTEVDLGAKAKCAPTLPETGADGGSALLAGGLALMLLVGGVALVAARRKDTAA